LRFAECEAKSNLKFNLPKKGSIGLGALNRRIFALVVLACLLAAGVLSHQAIPSASGVGVANVIVASVYWGSNPMNPSAARPGDANVQLSIVLSNVGDDVARGVNATLSIGPPLTYSYFTNGRQYSVTTISKVAGDINPGMSFTVSYTVNVDPNAQEGIYGYNLQVTYNSARELQQITSNIMVDVPIWKGDLVVQSIVTVPTKIYPDSKQVLLKVLIANTGQAAASDIQLQLVLKPPFSASSSGSDRIYVGNIPPGQISEADFIVDVASDAQFGQYTVILGEQSGVNVIPIGQLPFYINEKVKFQIVSVAPDSVSAGDSGRVVQVALKNTGSVKADSVRVQLMVGNFFTGTLTDFLGTMQPGETKTAFFTVDIDSSAQPGKYNLDLRLDWTQDNNALDDTQTIQLTVMAAAPPLTLIAIGVVVLVVVVAYALVRRRRAKAAQTATK
jgi:hypothetical protein